MRAEHLQVWLVAETREDTHGSTTWLKVVDLVQTTFREVFLV